MHTLGRYSGASVNLDGALVISFEVTDKSKTLEELEPLKDYLLAIDAKKYREKRSLDANAYFWQLCDKMAKTLGTDKWTVYLMQLAKYGVFVDLAVRQQALQSVRKLFRYVEILNEYEDVVELRGYYGSSEYDTKEMSDLINGTVSDARDLGVETLTAAEIEQMLALYEKRCRQ